MLLLTLLFSLANLPGSGFPCDSAGKEPACNVGDLGSIPALGTAPGEGKGCHSSILAWRIPWTIQGGPWGRKESDTTERLNTHARLYCD